MLLFLAEVLSVVPLVCFEDEDEEDEGHERCPVSKVWRKELPRCIRRGGRFADAFQMEARLSERIGHRVQWPFQNVSVADRRACANEAKNPGSLCYKGTGAFSVGGDGGI